MTLAGQINRFYIFLLLFIGWTIPSFSQNVKINEFMSSNSSTISDEDGAYSDWMEIYNPEPVAVNLKDYGLTDNPSQPFKWTLPDISIEPGAFLLVWASGKNRKPTSDTTIAGIRQEVFWNIPGVSVDDLLNHSSFPDLPGQRSINSQSFSSTPNIGDNYGMRMHGHFKAPATGNYIFRVAGDDNTRLFLSLDDVPENATLIAEVPEWTNPGEYNFYPEQQSALIFLQEGQSYYMSVLLKEGGGGDHLSVQMVTPSGATETPMSASHFYLTVNELHTNYSISAEGETLQLTAPDGTIIDQIIGLPLPSDVSYGRSSDGFDELVYFQEPTPGASNTTSGSIGILNPPDFDIKGKLFKDELEIVLSSDDPGATIIYTLDGSEPTASNGIEFASSITLSSTALVRARTIKTGYIHSEMAAEVYSLTDNSLDNFTSNLPVIILHQFDTLIQPGEGTISYLTIIGDGVNRTQLIDDYDLQGRVDINIRGSSSQQFPKKSYGFHLFEENGSNRKEVLLGMPSEHNWILYAPYTDKTMMRDVMAYDIGRAVGSYAPGTKYVEVFLHSESGPLNMTHYNGVYALVERIKIAPGRLDLQELEPHHSEEPEVTGGYIFKKDRLGPGESGFATDRGSDFVFVRPNEVDITPAQRDWLQDHLSEWETVLFGPDFKDPVNGYRKYIDVQTFIDIHLITEVFKQIDGYRLSTFLHKDRGGKLKMGPLWDFNLSLGNADYLEGWIPEGWYFEMLNEYEYLNGWYTRLFEDEAFVEEYKRRYQTLRANVFSTEEMVDKIRDYATLLEESQVRNYEKWDILGQYVWPNWFIGQTYQEEVDWMVQWLENRLIWMDSQLGGAIQQELIHYWNYNSETEFLLPSYTVGGASVNIIPASGSEVLTGTGQDFSGENARNGDPAATHLRINFPIGVSSDYSLPTTGYQNIVLKYETRRSGSGGNRQYISYTLDGNQFTLFDSVIVTEAPTVYTFDFTTVDGVNNNPDFKVRISMDQVSDGTGGDAGNNRFDNLTLEGELFDPTELLHYWNFNEELDFLLPNYTIGGAELNINPGATSVVLTGTGQDFAGLNARNGDPVGSHLRLNFPIGLSQVYSLPTAGYQQIILKYETRRSGSGANRQYISYTVNGTDFIVFDTIVVTEEPDLYTLDFSGIAEVNNNPEFAVRIESIQDNEDGTGGDVGNQRLDNVTLEGEPFEEPDVLLHYWNYNNDPDFLIANYTIGVAETIIEPGDLTEVLTGTGQDFNGENARNGDPAGSHLRVNFPIGASQIYTIPTPEFQDIIVKYETRRSGSGGNRQYIAYTLNGADFVGLDTLEVTEVPTVYTFDFSDLAEADDNDNFGFRISMDYVDDGTGGDAGNNRFDNFTVEGSPLEGANSPPQVSFNLSWKELGVGAGDWVLALSDIFTDADGDALTYSVETEKDFYTSTSLTDLELTVSANISGSNTLRVFATDQKSPPVFFEVSLLQYPDAAILTDNSFSFNSWDPELPEGSFPVNMVFVQSQKNDPELADELQDAYHIPADDYGDADLGNIGFPYKNTSRTRINGLNEDGISFINTGRGRDLGAAVAAVNTEGMPEVAIGFTASTLIANSRTYNLRVQYRVGAEGDWKEIDAANPIEYKRNENTGEEEIFKNILLPEESLNQPYVLIRWKYYYTGIRLTDTSGARDMIRLDDINIGNPSVTGAVNLIAPPDESVDIALKPEFIWTQAPVFGVEYQLQLGKNPDGPWEFEFTDLEETSFMFPDNLAELTTYYWRVGWSNDLFSGDWSDVYSFTTELMIATNEGELNANRILIYPNPASVDKVLFNKAVSGDLLDVRGKVVKSIQNQNQMDIIGLASGLYIFRSSDNQHLKLMIIR
jgi:hypothetical protein